MSSFRQDRLRAALIVSLAFNLFVIGVVSAGWIGGWDLLPFPRQEEQRVSLMTLPNPRQLRAVLPESDREIMETFLTERRPEIRPYLRDLASAREQVVLALRGEPFERDQLEKTLTELRERQTVTAVVVQAAFVDLMERINPEGRARVADLMPTRKFDKPKP